MTNFVFSAFIVKSGVWKRESFSVNTLNMVTRAGSDCKLSLKVKAEKLMIVVLSHFYSYDYSFNSKNVVKLKIENCWVIICH